MSWTTRQLPGVGILGGGFMAGVHAHAARAAGARLIGIASSTPERGRLAADRLRTVAYPSVEHLLLDDEIDVVHVCTPNALHAGQVRSILAAGKAVVCEKPLALGLADAQALQEAAAGRTATVPFVYRYHPLVREARERVRSGAAGRIYTISGRYLQDWLVRAADDNWRVDPALGGASRAFADIGSHLVDMLEFVTADRISRLAALTSTVLPQRSARDRVGTEDAAAVTFETTGGAIGTLLVSQVAPGRKNMLEIEIAFANETQLFNQERPDVLWLGGRDGSRVVDRGNGGLSADAARLSVVPAGHPQGYQDAFNAFVADTYDALAGGEPEGLPSFADGARAVAVTEAVLRSARERTWTEVAAPAALREKV